MEATIDNAGRLVIPKKLRDELGIAPGPVEILRDGAGIRIEPLTHAGLEQVEGRLVIPASPGSAIGDDAVRELRLADQR
jgi:AbrB family looped-hinge helix DNA binding protein